MHSTKNLEDGYIGSGKRLWYSINKYGKENHNCERLEFLPSRKELVKREKEIINEELLSDEQCMNLALGGDGGFEYLNQKLTPEQRTKAGLAGGFANRDKWSEQTKEKIKEACSKGGTKAQKRIHKEIKEGTRLNPWLGKTHSEETKDKLRKSKNQGEKNSSYGTCWIYHDLIGSRKCKKELLPEYIEQGWIKGRRIRR